MTQSEINFENAAKKTASLEEFESVPLKQRLKLLLASNRIAIDSDLKSERSDFWKFKDEENVEHKHLNSSHTIAAAISDKVGSVGISSLDESLFVENTVKVKVECAEMSDEFLDELDHVVLKERLRRLLTSKCLGLPPTVLEESSAEAVKGELRFDDQRHVVSGKKVHEIDSALKSAISNGTMTPFCKPHQTLGHCSQGNSFIYTDSLRVHRNISDSGNTPLFDDIRTVQTSLTLANIKVELPNFDESQSSYETTVGQMLFRNSAPVKSEVQTAGDAYEDELDHMLLRERIKLLSSRDYAYSDIHQSSKCTSKNIPPALVCGPVGSRPAPSVKINRPRKRRKTATDSVETAMDEDAPGLLEVLIEKGVSINEIKLYGEPESDDALDDSSMKDSFAELEEVITKLFSHRESLLKFGPLRCTTGEKASYCLECLFSLVEQARYLQFRHWPVEWGWCRDLQSFIFVFERHNRIVLERPEYGYATYFFELEDSLPIAWQIKRLIIAMKLTSCSRITLIENKALMVGDDLTEGEARVLMEYGWIPNTGLGTMLNYYDRVVHDRRTEQDRSEWRSKIGKLLMNGYNSGTIVPTGIPSKVMEYNAEHALQVKLELS